MAIDDIIELFRQRRENDLAPYEIGERRTRLCENALEILKRERIIADYLPTGFLSGDRVRRGIAFYVAVVRDSRYISVSLGVTGPASLDRNREKHPELRFLPLDLDEKPENVAMKILNILDTQRGPLVALYPHTQQAG